MSQLNYSRRTKTICRPESRKCSTVKPKSMMLPCMTISSHYFPTTNFPACQNPSKASTRPCNTPTSKWSKLATVNSSTIYTKPTNFRSRPWGSSCGNSLTLSSGSKNMVSRIMTWNLKTFYLTSNTLYELQTKDLSDHSTWIAQSRYQAPGCTRALKSMKKDHTVLN